MASSAKSLEQLEELYCFSEVINKKRVFEDFLNSIDDGVTIQDITGRLIFVNNTAAQASGYSSTEEMIKKPRRWVKRFELRDENGDPFNLGDFLSKPFEMNSLISMVRKYTS